MIEFAVCSRKYIIIYVIFSCR